MPHLTKKRKNKKGKIKQDADCYFCGKPIFLKNEVDNILFVSKGKPICAVCRVLRKGKGKGRLALLKDRQKHADEMQEKENLRIMSVAKKSQERKEAKKVKLKKKKNKK